MKRGQIIMQGDFWSLYYDGELYTRQFPVTVNKNEVKEALAVLMPDYIFS